MAYTRYGNRSYGNKKYNTSRKSKYSQSERVAFRLGQEQRIKASINSTKPSRVQDAFAKGLKGFPQTDKNKSLFAD